MKPFLWWSPDKRQYMLKNLVSGEEHPIPSTDIAPPNYDMTQAFISRTLFVCTDDWHPAQASQTALERFAWQFGLSLKDIETAQWKARMVRQSRELERLEVSA